MIETVILPTLTVDNASERMHESTSLFRRFIAVNRIITKKLLILSVLLMMISGCQIAQDSMHRTGLTKDCEEVAERQGRNSGWVQRCSNSRTLLNDALKGEILCKEWGGLFKRGHDWIFECTLSAAKAHEQVIDTQLMRLNPDALCKIVWLAYGGVTGKMSQSVSEKRGLNCGLRISKWARKAIMQTPKDKLCSVFLNKVGHPVYYSEVAKEVRHRGYRCE